MNEVHDLLRESIIRENIRDPEDRARVYAEARRAVVRRLWDHDPPIEIEEIDSQIAEFDAAVSAIERGLQSHFVGGEEAVSLALADSPAEARDLPADTVEAYDWHDDRQTYPHEVDEDEDDYDDGYMDEGAPLADADPGAAEDFDDDREYYPPPATAADTAEAYDRPLGYDADGYDDYDEASYRAPAQADRWSEPPNRAIAARTVEVRAAGKRRRPPRNGSRMQVGLLVGAIVVMVAGLGAFGWLFLSSGVAAPERTVTVAIEDRRQVSDAATAIRVANEDVTITQTFSVFDGFDPTVFEAAADNPVRFENDGAGGYARVASSSGSSGARVVIGPGLAEQLAGREVRVRILVRESADRGAGSMRFAYQSGVAISHWQTATLEKDYNEVGILWRVPSLRTSDAGDYLVIEPGIPGDGTGVDIRAVEIDILAAS